MKPDRPTPSLLALVYGQLADPGGAYLVGGAVRDHLLARPTLDLDLVVPGRAADLARRIARASAGGFVLLDPERDIARVAFADGATLDLAAQVGPAIQDDLLRRDFTVNAMALPLLEAESWLASPAGPGSWDPVIDPTNGRADLNGRTIRMVSHSALVDDPLRLLRAPRLAAELGFAIEPATAAAILECAALLAIPAAERIRDELLRTLAAAGAGWTARMYAALGLEPSLNERLSLSFDPAAEPEAAGSANASDPSKVPGLDRKGLGSASAGQPTTLAALERLDQWLGTTNTGPMAAAPAAEPGSARPPGLSAPGPIEALIASAIGRQTMNYSHSVWLQLAGLLSNWRGADLATPVSAALRGLAIGGRAATLVQSTWRAATELRALADAGDIDAHRVYRLLSHYGEGASGGLLLVLSESDSEPASTDSARRVGPLLQLASTTHAMWTAHFDPTTRQAPLLGGAEVMAELGIGEGPQVGALLAAAHEAQACGEITTEAEAWRLVRGLHESHQSPDPRPAPTKR